MSTFGICLLLLEVFCYWWSNRDCCWLSKTFAVAGRLLKNFSLFTLNINASRGTVIIHGAYQAQLPMLFFLFRKCTKYFESISVDYHFPWNIAWHLLWIAFQLCSKITDWKNVPFKLAIPWYLILISKLLKEKATR